MTPWLQLLSSLLVLWIFPRSLASLAAPRTAMIGWGRLTGSCSKRSYSGWGNKTGFSFNDEIGSGIGTSTLITLILDRIFVIRALFFTVVIVECKKKSRKTHSGCNNTNLIWAIKDIGSIVSIMQIGLSPCCYYSKQLWSSPNPRLDNWTDEIVDERSLHFQVQEWSSSQTRFYCCSNMAPRAQPCHNLKLSVIEF